jgi:polyisoprenyl-phosphate glycosyltransferase
MNVEESPLVTVVLPVFNEGNHLSDSLAEIRKCLQSAPVRYELVLVDDGSTDSSWAEMEKEHGEHGDSTALKLSRNFGKEAAISCGLDHARGDAVIIMDSDLQHPPALLPRMIEMWQKERFDVVEGVKETVDEEGAIERVRRSAFNSLFSRCTGLSIQNASDYKLLDRKVVDAWRKMGEHTTFFRGMVTWLGFAVGRIPFQVQPRAAGTTKWETLTLLRYARQSMTSFTAKPLYLIAALGILFLASAFVMGAYALYYKLAGLAVTGFTTVILLQLGIGGCILFSLALIGNYIAGIYEEVKGRPRYVVSDRTEP